MADIFVALTPFTKDCVIFGKNANQPPTDVQQVIYCAGADCTTGSKVKTTLLEIDQVSRTHACVLSQTAGSWGAEMGANDQGVCAGYTSVFTKLSSLEGNMLTPSDLTRLILERSGSAKSAVLTVTSLIDQNGQGGRFGVDNPRPYCGVFLIADRDEAWVVECAGKSWVAKQITEGTCAISNCLSISTDYTMTSSNLQEQSVTSGHWSSEKGPVDFAVAFGDDPPTEIGCTNPTERRSTGSDLLKNIANHGSFSTKDMFEILRKMAIEDSRLLQTTGSHVTILSSAGLPDSHWFTGTPCPSLSVFKPFMFSDNVDIGDYTRSLSKDDKRHVLYKYHEKARELMASGSPKGEALSQLMRSLEGKCVVEMDEFCQQFSVENISDVDELFKDICESEIKFYL